MPSKKTIERFEPSEQYADFAFVRRVEDFVKARGFSIGPMQREDPRGIMPAEYDVQKWRNLSAQDRRELHGVMTFIGGPRQPRVIEIEWRKP